MKRILNTRFISGRKMNCFSLQFISSQMSKSLNDVLRRCCDKNHTAGALVADEFSLLTPLRRESFRCDKEESAQRVEARDCV
jgi:hypothetical protein